jgi:hypothetical protein
MSPQRVCRPSLHEKDELDRLWKVVQEAAAMLRSCPVPDTFLGRKTQEPFPKQDIVYPLRYRRRIAVSQ